MGYDNTMFYHHIEARRPDILVVEKDSKKALIIDIASSGDHYVVEKESEKVETNQEIVEPEERRCDTCSCWCTRISE